MEQPKAKKAKTTEGTAPSSSSSVSQVGTTPGSNNNNDDDKNKQRRNMFETPHKLFRHAFFDLSVKMGSVDVQSEKEIEELIEFADLIISFYQHHNVVESKEFAPAIQSHAENVCREWLSDHDKFLTQLEEMKTKIKSLKNMSAKERSVTTQELYSDINAVISEDLKHMHFEETTIMKLFWEHYSDHEIEQIELNSLKNQPFDPLVLVKVTPWAMRAHNNEGRTIFLQIMQTVLPAEKFEEAIQMTKKVLSSEQLEKISQATNIQKLVE